MLVQGLEIVTSFVQSGITCTQEWNVVQYLVNKTNMDSFHNESLSVIMKIAPYTVTHLFDPFHQIHIALPSEIKWIIVLLHHNRISSVRVLDYRAGGLRFDFWDQTNTQGLNMTEKWRYCLCPANSFAWLWWPRKMAVPTPAGDKNSVPNQHVHAKYIDTQIKCFFY